MLDLLQPTGIGIYIRLRHAARLINAIAEQGATVVDVGGGEGLLIHRLRPDLRPGYTVVDAMPDGLGHRLTGDITNLPVGDSSVEMLVCTDVLEHVADDRALVRHMVTKVASGGTMIIHVPALRKSLIPGFEEARRNAEAIDDQPFPHVRDGYTHAGLLEMLNSSVPGGSKVHVEPSFTPAQTVISDIDWLLWARGLSPFRIPGILWARMMRGSAASSRNSAGLLGVIRLH